MAKNNERTSAPIAKLAGKVLGNGGKATPAQVKKLAGSVLTQATSKPTKRT